MCKIMLWYQQPIDYLWNILSPERTKLKVRTIFHRLNKLKNRTP